jgi:hypothetical protein
MCASIIEVHAGCARVVVCARVVHATGTCTCVRAIFYARAIFYVWHVCAPQAVLMDITDLTQPRSPVHQKLKKRRMAKAVIARMQCLLFACC